MLPRYFLEHMETLEEHMPILLWFLGVPLGLVVVLMLFGVV